MEYIATNLKADKFTFPVLELLSPDIDRIASEIEAKVDQAPAFFRNAPVVIDLKHLEDEESVEFPVLVGLLRSFGLNPIGIRGGTEDHEHSAATMELAIFAEDRKESGQALPGDGYGSETEISSEPPAPAAAPDIGTENRVHLRPVRSGQKLAAPRGDLILVSSASAGSELIAAGNIHVYGALRGRAIAGVGGDESCRIFCQHLDAELVSIAGQYRISEDIDDGLRGRPVQIYLEADRLNISPIGDS